MKAKLIKQMLMKKQIKIIRIRNRMIRVKIRSKNFQKKIKIRPNKIQLLNQMKRMEINSKTEIKG